MLRLGAGDCRGPDGLIEGHEPPLVSDRKRQQVAIGELLGTEQSRQIEFGRVGQADVIGPEPVVAAVHCLRKAGQDLGHR